MGQKDNPKEIAFELVTQVPGQVKKASQPRKQGITRGASGDRKKAAGNNDTPKGLASRQPTCAAVPT